MSATYPSLQLKIILRLRGNLATYQMLTPRQHDLLSSGREDSGHQALATFAKTRLAATPVTRMLALRHRLRVHNPRLSRSFNSSSPRHNELQQDVERCRKMSKDVERCRKMSKDVERCRKMSKDVERCRKMSKVSGLKKCGSERCSSVSSSSSCAPSKPVVNAGRNRIEEERWRKI